MRVIVIARSSVCSVTITNAGRKWEKVDTSAWCSVHFLI